MSEVPDPKTWVTGADDITPKQAEFLKRLCDEHGVQYNPNWSKAEASAKIEELKNGPPDNKSVLSTTATGKDGDSLLDNPDQWTTGNEEATDKQKRYIAAMASRRGEDPASELGDATTKSAASAKIDELKHETGM